MAEDATENRLVKIEMALAHLQHDVDLIHSSLTEHLKRLQSFETKFAKLEHEIELLHEEPEERDPQAERPPHY